MLKSMLTLFLVARTSLIYNAINNAAFSGKMTSNSIYNQIRSNTSIVFDYFGRRKGTKIQNADEYGCQSIYNFFDKVKLCDISVDRHYIKYLISIGYPEEEDAYGETMQLRVFDLWEQNVKSMRDIIIYDGQMFMSGDKAFGLKTQDYTLYESGVEEFYEYLKKKVEYKFASKNEEKSKEVCVFP